MAYITLALRTVAIFAYLTNLSTGRIILWCYFIWWLVSIIHHFDATPRIWLTSLGLSGIIGMGLIFSTQSSSGVRSKLDRWVMFRLFLMPFCVSSFAALVKDAGFILIFPPSLLENTIGISLILIFLFTVGGVKKIPGAIKK